MRYRVGISFLFNKIYSLTPLNCCWSKGDSKRVPMLQVSEQTGFINFILNLDLSLTHVGCVSVRILPSACTCFLDKCGFTLVDSLGLNRVLRNHQESRVEGFLFSSLIKFSELIRDSWQQKCIKIKMPRAALPWLLPRVGLLSSPSSLHASGRLITDHQKPGFAAAAL